MVADGLAVGLLDLVAHRARTEGHQKANNAGKASARPARRAAKRGTTLGEGENAGHVYFCALGIAPVIQLYTHSHEWTKASIFHADAAEQATPLHRLRRRRLTPGTQPGYDQSEEGEGGNEDAIPVHAELIVIVQARVPCSLRSPLHVWLVPSVGVHPQTVTAPRGGCAIIIVITFCDGAAAPADRIIVGGSPLGVAEYTVCLGEVRKELLCFGIVVHIGVQAERELSVSLLDLRRRRPPVQAERRVMVN